MGQLISPGVKFRVADLFLTSYYRDRIRCSSCLRTYQLMYTHSVTSMSVQ